jgi:hypothetical protein
VIVFWLKVAFTLPGRATATFSLPSRAMATFSLLEPAVE